MKRKSAKKTEELKSELGNKTSQKKSIKQEQVKPNDYGHIHQNQQKMKMMHEEARKKKTIQSFSKVKYKQHIYEIGEFLHLYDPEQKNPYVVRLHEISRVPTKEEEGGGLTILKVEWLLKKSDLPPKYNKYVKHLSTAETFPSGLFWYVPIESIMRKCYIITYDEYEYLENAGDMIFFCRALYDHETEELDPRITEFKKECYCQMPVNPDLMYIQCQKCNGWFHEECLKDQAHAQIFFCKNCNK